jgi:hypothetical protein
VWSTTYKAANDERRFFPIPMDMMFDMDHCNSFRHHLPILVDSIQDSDCWDLHKDKEEFRKSLSNPGNRSFMSPTAAAIFEHSILLTPIPNTTRL